MNLRRLHVHVLSRMGSPSSSIFAQREALLSCRRRKKAALPLHVTASLKHTVSEVAGRPTAAV